MTNALFHSTFKLWLKEENYNQISLDSDHRAPGNNYENNSVKTLSLSINFSLLQNIFQEKKHQMELKLSVFKQTLKNLLNRFKKKNFYTKKKVKNKIFSRHLSPFKR